MTAEELKQRWLEAHKLSKQAHSTGDRELVEDREREEIELRTAFLSAREKSKVEREND